MPHKVKQHILETLRAAGNGWVSGEALREPFGISRAAISKQVNTLKEKGYEIESGPRKGYRLLGEPDDLGAEVVLPLLRGTRFGAAGYRVLRVTQSTNDDALALARAGAGEGAMVLAEQQLAGRGRRGRVWYDKPGDSLMFSVVLRPPLEPAQCALLPLLAAASVRGGMQFLGFDGVGIKWPNDVLIRGRKFGGILCEMSSEFDRVDHAVIGMGLNINTPAEAFPGEVRDIACSLLTATGTRWKRMEVLAAILQCMDLYLAEAWEGRFERMMTAWREGSVTLGKNIQATLPNGQVIEGMAEALDPSGALVLRERTGHTRLLTGGEVSLGTGRSQSGA